MNPILLLAQFAPTTPQQTHAAVVHLPIAAALFGLVLLIGLIVTRGQNRALRWMTVIVFALGASAGFSAMETGEDAIRANTPAAGTLSDAAADELEEHEEAGEKIWIALAVTGALVAASAVKPPVLRAVALGLATVASLATLAGVAVTAHRGGQLVYRYGVGVPHTSNNNPADEPTSAPGDAAPSTQPAAAHEDK